MLKITLLVLGKLKEKYLRDAQAEYVKRLGGLCNFTVVELEPARLPDRASAAQISAALENEAARILAKIPAGAKLVPMCIEGKQLSSEELAQTLEKYEMESGQVVFIIGSSYGLAERVKSAGHVRLSMSKMTFPHQLARIMLEEQIYRALKIRSGSAYHK